MLRKRKPLWPKQPSTGPKWNTGTVKKLYEKRHRQKERKNANLGRTRCNGSTETSENLTNMNLLQKQHRKNA
mgnify:CR=1 FL=1